MFVKPQLKHVPYGASTSVVAAVAIVVATALVGIECLAAGSIPVNATC
jgi:hypothetical protein